MIDTDRSFQEKEEEEDFPVFMNSRTTFKRANKTPALTERTKSETSSEKLNI